MLLQSLMLQAPSSVHGTTDKCSNVSAPIQVRKVIWALFALCPTPEAMVAADLSAIGDIVAPLGLNRKRGAMLQRFSKDYLTKDVRSPPRMRTTCKG